MPQERILVLTGADQAEAVRALLPKLPPDNLIVEPARRDTAAAMALAAGIVGRRNPNATVIALPSDHHILSRTDFQHTLQKACAAASNSQSVVAIAIPPDWPCPGFGYLELGHPLPPSPQEAGSGEVFPILSYREKPPVHVAEQYLAQGNFRWNAGMFAWTVCALQSALQQTAPELFQFSADLQTVENPARLLEERFSTLPKISFDFAVMEKLSGSLAVEADFDWDDLGGWNAAGKYFPTDSYQNASNTLLQATDSSGNIVYSTHPGQHVALLGVQDLIIVNTGDALLVCPKDQSERLKEIVGKLPPHLA